MKKFSLAIPKPCNENWDAMTPDAKGRFCGACQKTVIDFTSMSDREIAQFFKKPAPSVCGRFGGDQLNRAIEVPRKRIPWVKYFFTIALPAFLFSKKSAAQGNVRIIDTTVGEKIVFGNVWKKMKILPEKTANEIHGRVSDEKGNPIESATVSVKGTTLKTATDKEGKFFLKNVTNDKREIIVSSVGFMTQTVFISDRGNVNVSLHPALMGEVVTVGKVIRQKPVAIPLVKPKTDTSVAGFTVYPNPVSPNATVALQPKSIKPGNYFLTIINESGNAVQTEELVVEKKASDLFVGLKNLAAGAYFIRLTNKKTGKSYTQKMLVQ